MSNKTSTEPKPAQHPMLLAVDGLALLRAEGLISQEDAIAALHMGAHLMGCEVRIERDDDGEVL